MLISFECEQCGRRYKVDESKVGQVATCRDCDGEIRVPVPGPDSETTPADTAVYRHQARERDFEPAIAGDSIEVIDQHIERHIGPVAGVLHELGSDLVHIDVHQVPPTDNRPFWTLVTSGMSDRPMTVPEGAEAYEFAELMMCLPPDWPMSQESFGDEQNYWPIRLLKILARLPQEYDTWLGPGHTVPNSGEDDVPYADGTGFTCALLLPPMLVVPSDFSRVELDDRVINFHAVWPMFPSEVEYKLTHGLESLLDRFEKHQVTELVEIDRANTCASPGWMFWKK